MVRFSDIFKKKEKGSSQIPPAPPEMKVTPVPSQQTTPEPAKKDEFSPRIRVIRIPEDETQDVSALKQRDNTTQTSTFRKEDEKGKIGVTPSVPREGITKSQPISKEVSTLGKISFAEAIRKQPEQEQSTIPKPSDVKDISLGEIIRQEAHGKFQRADKLYKQLLDIIQNIVIEGQPYDDLAQIDYTVLSKPVDEIINLIITGDRTLLDMACQYSPEEFFKFHLFNVSIVSLYLGYGLGYNKSKLTELGILSLLHEIEIGKDYRIIRPSEKGFPGVEPFISPSLGKLEKFKYLASIIPSCFKPTPVSDTHSRPSVRSRSPNVDDYIKLITLVDAYETLCRPRPHLKKIHPHLVIKRLIESAETFDKNLVKILIKLIGFYPVGTWVELITGEVARVVNINEKSPLRPVVQIQFDEERHQLQDIKTLDLASNQNVYIKAPISEDELL